MRRTLMFCAVLLIGCAKSEPPASTTPETAAPATLSLADVAGTWEGTFTAVGNDTALGMIELNATGEPTGWSMKVANAKTPTEWTTVPATSVVVEGDAVAVDAGPFPSVLRPGQEVSTRTVYRLEGGNLVGTIEAKYAATNETITLSTTATRKAP